MTVTTPRADTALLIVVAMLALLQLWRTRAAANVPTAPQSESHAARNLTQKPAASVLGGDWVSAAALFVSATQAANIQLCVPVLAAIGGVLFVNEAITLALVVSSLAILGGIALVLRQSR